MNVDAEHDDLTREQRREIAETLSIRAVSFDLESVDQRINDWIEYVKAERGFTTQHLYSSLTNSFLDALEGDDQ